MKTELQYNRRSFLKTTTWLAVGMGAVAGGGLIYRNASKPVAAGQNESEFEITFSAGEWKERLSDAQYAILREEGTEQPYSSALLDEKRAGNYNCAGCDLAVYPSKTKYDSKTGWPSFWEALPNAIGTKPDNSLFATRTEVHCRRCGGHFGHIFDDGPEPTGKRHCLNGLALTFRNEVG